jgi:CYTH domain-containing protein
LIARFGEGKVRVRIANDKALITIKGPRTGLRRAEFEYEVPHADAEEMLNTLCAGPLVEKTRYFVQHDGLTWHVDVYHGVLEGLVLAEVELAREDQLFARPDWAGREVTGDPRYKSANIFKYHAKSACCRPQQTDPPPKHAGQACTLKKCGGVK